MKSPVGMEENDPGSSSEDCYQLLKGIYGLCQAARQFCKKFVNTVKQEPFGFQVSPADPCMLFKKKELGVCIIIMYVDDMLIIGKRNRYKILTLKYRKNFQWKYNTTLQTTWVMRSTRIKGEPEDGLDNPPISKV